MPPGKLAAQVAHACCQSLLLYLQSDPEAAAEFLHYGASGTRVILSVPRPWDIERAIAKAKERALPTALFEDSGHVLPPHFDGSPILTAAAIGPAPRDLIRPIIRSFQTV